jgi:hypothetical protein
MPRTDCFASIRLRLGGGSVCGVTGLEASNERSPSRSGTFPGRLSGHAGVAAIVIRDVHEGGDAGRFVTRHHVESPFLAVQHAFEPGTRDKDARADSDSA